MKSLLLSSSLQDEPLPLSNISVSESSRTRSMSSSNEDNSRPKDRTYKVKYKRRRRVYEKIQPEYRYRKLQTVIEGEELRSSNSRFSVKVTVLLLAFFICIAGIRETTRMIRESKDETTRAEDKLKRVERGNSTRDESSREEDIDGELTEIPDELRHLANIETPFLPTDRAFFWHIPRSGGVTVKMIVSQCLKLTLASEQGAADASDNLSVLSDTEGNHFVNVNTYAADGIVHAKDLNLATFPRLDLIASPFIYDISEHILSSDYRGRCFTILRHPVDRAISSFYDSHATLSEETEIEDYVDSDRLAPNWMTRVLSNTLEDELTTTHLEIAKHVLEDRCIVGLLRSKGESMRRIENYFGWKLDGEVGTVSSYFNRSRYFILISF